MNNLLRNLLRNLWRNLLRNSNLQQVGDFSVFGSKSSLVQGVILKSIFD